MNQQNDSERRASQASGDRTGGWRLQDFKAVVDQYAPGLMFSWHIWLPVFLLLLANLGASLIPLAFPSLTQRAIDQAIPTRSMPLFVRLAVTVAVLGSPVVMTRPMTASPTRNPRRSLTRTRIVSPLFDSLTAGPIARRYHVMCTCGRLRTPGSMPLW